MKTAADELLEELAGQRIERDMIQVSLDLAERLIVDTISDALDTGVSWTQLGKALKKDRATLYRWYQLRKR